MEDGPSFTPTGERGRRRPNHTFNVVCHMHELQPIVLAPVLPGETLRSMHLQSRVISANVKSRVAGAWLEYFFFYVPVRQMPDAANILATFLSPTTSLAASAQNIGNYVGIATAGYDWMAQCKAPILTEWFRREGEATTQVIRTGRPAVAVPENDISDSLIDATILPDGGALASIQDDDIRAKMIVEYRRALALSGSEGGTTDYEELLSSYGAFVRKAKERDRPELIRYMREWTYPSNTVEPTTGVPTTAFSWSVADGSDKPRRFNEFGFVVGFMCIRPKTYRARQFSNASVALDRAQRWLPPMMDDVGIEKGLMEFLTTTGPYGATTGGFTNGYWLDIRDLFNYGDQWMDTNNEAIVADRPKTSLPTSGTIQNRFPTLADMNGLLLTADALAASDGVCRLDFSTQVVDPS